MQIVVYFLLILLIDKTYKYDVACIGFHIGVQVLLFSHLVVQYRFQLSITALELLEEAYEGRA